MQQPKNGQAQQLLPLFWAAARWGKWRRSAEMQERLIWHGACEVQFANEGNQTIPEGEL
jgi:hypothetical protein